MDESKLTHLSERGEAHMVDVGEKAVTRRIAVARTQVQMQPQTLELIESAGIKKGDVFSVARIAGIMAAKQTSALIPLCHPLQLTRVEVTMAGRRTEAEARVEIEAIVETRDRTGVEMEALTAASIAALTIYDMCKAVDRGMTVHQTYLARKEGGKSGLFVHEKERE